MNSRLARPMDVSGHAACRGPMQQLVYFRRLAELCILILYDVWEQLLATYITTPRAAADQVRDSD